MGEGVGEVAEGPAVRVELLLEAAGRRRRPARARAARSRRCRAACPCRPRSTEMTVRVSSRGASRLPEMLVPPPNGITTASASSAALRTRRPRSSSPGRTTTSGSRPRSPRRCRMRSRRLLPRAWTTRSRASSETYASPTAALERGAERAAQLRRGDVEVGEGERPRGRLRDVDPEVLRRNGRKLGLSSWENETPSSPHPHHFIAPCSAGRVATAVMAPTLLKELRGWDSNPQPIG